MAKRKKPAKAVKRRSVAATTEEVVTRVEGRVGTLEREFRQWRESLADLIAEVARSRPKLAERSVLLLVVDEKGASHVATVATSTIEEAE